MIVSATLEIALAERYRSALMHAERGMATPHRIFALFVGVLLAGATADAETLNWQEAVARLAHERSVAESCAAVLKRYGDRAAIDRGSLVYAEAKADYDAIVSGLSVALARGTQPASLSDLEKLLSDGFEKRTTFCQSAAALLPPTADGTRGVIDQIVSGAVGPVVDALKAIWIRSDDDDALRRKTIATQLEATKWPAFASVSPSS